MVYNSDHALHATRHATYIRKCTGHESAIGFKLPTGEDLASHLRIDKPALLPQILQHVTITFPKYMQC